MSKKMDFGEFAHIAISLSNDVWTGWDENDCLGDRYYVSYNGVTFYDDGEIRGLGKPEYTPTQMLKILKKLIKNETKRKKEEE